MSVLWQLLQVANLIFLSPLISGVIAYLVARLESKQGVSIFQPYYDLVKYFRKERLLPGKAGWLYILAPPVVVASMLAVVVMIPVLTTYPLSLWWLGDLLGGAFVLTLGSVMQQLAAFETGNSYGGLGASRESVLSILTEPTLIMVLVASALLAHSTYPYVVGETIRSGLNFLLAPDHVLATVAFFLLLLVETARLPIKNHDGHGQTAMIDEARTLEYAGADLALLKLGGYMKQFLFFVLFLNVFLAPWGMASGTTLADWPLAEGSLIAKMLGLCAIIALVETGLARLRFWRYSEYLGLAFFLAVLAAVTSQLAGGTP
jgi:formate hydrogenlyase subunit 4